MNTAKQFDQLFADAGTPRLEVNSDSRLVLMSDCHRGTGEENDDFRDNAKLYLKVLGEYHRSGYTYVELGDGDELWENIRLGSIRRTYPGIFEVLSDLAVQQRLIMLFGNHDIAKRFGRVVRRALQPFVKSPGMQLPKGFSAREALILTVKGTGTEILLVHGHQGSLFSDILWPVSWFFVRYAWRPLQWLGVKDPTSIHRDSGKQDAAERRMREWARDRRRYVIAGHTHVERFPAPGEVPYFNAGSSLVKGTLPAIQIANEEIVLVHWQGGATEDDPPVCRRVAQLSLTAPAVPMFLGVTTPIAAPQPSHP